MNTEDAFFARVVDQASARFRPSGRFAYHYARGKLGADPVFRALLRQGLLSRRAQLLDLGCGQGSLFSCLLAAQALAAAGQWPAGWAPPPQLRQLRGIELMKKDVARAARAFSDPAEHVRIEQGDLCRHDFGRADAVTILDALHYFDHASQQETIERIRAALNPGGIFITRVGDAAGGWPFHLSQAVDRLVTRLRGHRLPPLYCRSVSAWVALLESAGFQVEVQAMSGRTPFANHLLIGRI